MDMIVYCADETVECVSGLSCTQSIICTTKVLKIDEVYFTLISSYSGTWERVEEI